ncbi:MAG TPA: ribosome biogenesis GTPase Der [Burkholderiaceae bacterium]|nr:ribosome biogenesis GTPase Der [Burkholderiaceae bacterium]HQR75648.1 ribosome biogenesis GTPase Der [Burkholderiaceae bacterium]
MKPVIAIVGRPNVGKSTLFNRLTRSRAALVADFPGLTRDRHYGVGRVGPRDYIVIDTGGFEPLHAEGIAREMAAQAEQAIAESDAIVFVLDAREGVTAQDRRIGERLRLAGRPVWLAVNKAEGLPPEAIAEFHELGLGEPLAISAAHGEGVRDLMDVALAPFAQPEEDTGAAEAPGAARRVRVAVVGRPNVGKSTLINALLGEERLIAFDQPGTTRDAIEVEFDYGGRPYTLIDTAGLRRRGKVFEAVEKFSVVKTLQAISDANVVILLLDASAEVSDQDAHIAGYILESGRALVIAVNKWDGLDEYQRDRIRREIERKLHFLRWARVHTISALKRSGLAAVMRSVSEAHAAAFAKLPTPKLTRALLAAVASQMPPRAGQQRPKLRYAHQGGMNPPVIVIHGNSLGHVPETYRRYLEGHFRAEFKLTGTPLRVEFRTSRNPYAN